jgi:hypothetical protein
MLAACAIKPEVFSFGSKNVRGDREVAISASAAC